MAEPTPEAIVDALLERHGTTYAEEAGITLGDDPTPSPLYRLLCLATLLSARIRADAAVEASRALAKAGWRTAAAMADSTWGQRVQVLNEHGYARYDESTARMLGDSADLVSERWKGDLRRLRKEADGEPAMIGDLLQEAKGIGEVGAAIFCREIQACWPEVGPFLDDKAMAGAEALGLGSDRAAIADLVARQDLPRLAAALVRVDLADDANDVVEAAARTLSR